MMAAKRSSMASGLSPSAGRFLSSTYWSIHLSADTDASGTPSKHFACRMQGKDMQEGPENTELSVPAHPVSTAHTQKAR